MKHRCGLAIVTLLLVAMDLPAWGQAPDAGAASRPALLAWPPVLDSKNLTTESTDGRKIERYVHGPREAWGYQVNPSEWTYPAGQESGPSQQNHNSYYLVAPKTPHDNAPLCVVLHSANRTAYDYLGYASLNRKVDPSDNPPGAMTGSPDDFYALYLNSTNAEWWGWTQAQQHLKSDHIPTAAELRVMDTIEWVVSQSHIDRNRIYLCGLSMGGCGALAIGLSHGDVFAAVRVIVPAGTEYAAYRTGGLTLANLPDPPVVVDFSSQTDSWSNTQVALVTAAQASHLPLVLSWGPFGHTGDGAVVGKYPMCKIAMGYPWLEIRRDEAYPVFTHASSDQRAPWPTSAAGSDESGQTNSYFRWKNGEDSPARLTMRIWIENPAGEDLPKLPTSATTDVTLRRLQKFKIQAGKQYAWQWSRDGHVAASGKLTPDDAGLATFSQLSVTANPAELTLQIAE